VEAHLVTGIIVVQNHVVHGIKMVIVLEIVVEDVIEILIQQIIIVLRDLLVQMIQ
jgi:hypothetical protein